MNKKILMIIAISILVILILGVGGFFIWKSISDAEKNKEFAEKDLVIGEITYETKMEELIQKLGNPETKREYMDGNTGNTVVECLYDNDATVFEYRDLNDGNGFILKSVSSKNSQHLFSRELKVGSTKQQVLDAYSEKSLMENEELTKKNKIRFAKEGSDINSTGITYTFKKDVVTEISWNR